MSQLTLQSEGKGGRLDGDKTANKNNDGKA